MDTLDIMDTIMPLELWGISIGLITGILLWIGFLMFMDWLSNRH